MFSVKGLVMQKTMLRKRRIVKTLAVLLATEAIGLSLCGCQTTGKEGFDVRIDNHVDETEKTVAVTELDTDKEEMMKTDKVTSTTVYMNGDFELPLDGSMGIAVSKLDMHDADGNVIGQMAAGTEFTILAESDSDLKTELREDRSGVTLTGEVSDDIVYIDKDFVMINLPDVIPSIIYDNTNSYSSLLSSKGYSIANLTGEALYQTKYYNERLGEDEYVFPVLYTTAKKIKKVQEQMLADGNSLKLYESYRPFETQLKIIDALTEAMKTNSEINATITGAPWGKSWFIALKRSNHQRGCAIDATMVKVTGTEQKTAGSYRYTAVTTYEEYEMPTQIHDMSADSIALTNPVESMDREAWKSDPIAPTMTDAAVKLQNYMTANEMYPLASEWWHFNDIDSRENSDSNSGAGDFYITGCTSKTPAEAAVSANEDSDEDHSFSDGEPEKAKITVSTPHKLKEDGTWEVGDVAEPDPETNVISVEGTGVAVNKEEAEVSIEDSTNEAENADNKGSANSN